LLHLRRSTGRGGSQPPARRWCPTNTEIEPRCVREVEDLSDEEVPPIGDRMNARGVRWLGLTAWVHMPAPRATRRRSGWHLQRGWRVPMGRGFRLAGPGRFGPRWLCPFPFLFSFFFYFYFQIQVRFKFKIEFNFQTRFMSKHM
jgi:hypothetical protein